MTDECIRENDLHKTSSKSSGITLIDLGELNKSSVEIIFRI